MTFGVRVSSSLVYTFIGLRENLIDGRRTSRAGGCLRALLSVYLSCVVLFSYRGKGGAPSSNPLLTY